MSANLWDKFGICVAADIANGMSYDQAVVEEDANYLARDVGIQYFRISTAGWSWIRNNQSLIDRFRTIAQTYIDLGVNVQFVIGGSFDHAGSHELLDSYLDYVADTAQWAQSVGIQRLQLENELELGNYSQWTDAQVRDYVLTLPAIARAAGYTGHLTYSLAGGVYAFTNTGDYDSLGVNGYVHYNGSNGVQSAFNAFKNVIGIENSYVSEWGAYLNLDTTDPDYQSKEMLKLLTYLKNTFPAPCYLFAWKWINDSFAVKTLTGNKFRKFWYEITGQRSPISKYSHDFVHLSRSQREEFNINNVGGKALWLKADEGVYSDAGITPVTNEGRVYQWTDFSGQGNHAIQTTEYKRPYYYTDIKNGLPSLFFNGAEFNIMQCLNPSNFDIEWPTIFCVSQWNSGQSLFGKGNSTLYPNNTFRKLQFGASNSSTAIFRSGTDNNWISAPATMTDWNIFMMQGERSNMVNLKVNGVNKIATGSDMNFKDFNSVAFSIGAGFTDNEAERSVFSLLELIIFNRIVPKHQYQEIISYLSNKWDIAVSS